MKKINDPAGKAAIINLLGLIVVLLMILIYYLLG
jgi:hypothetical protein